MWGQPPPAVRSHQPVAANLIEQREPRSHGESREAAKECSPQRKLWVGRAMEPSSPEGAKENSPEKQIHCEQPKIEFSIPQNPGPLAVLTSGPRDLAGSYRCSQPLGTFLFRDQ